MACAEVVNGVLQTKRIEEKIMKRMITFILLAVMCLSLVACGASNTNTTTAGTQTETTAATTVADATTAPATETTSNTEETTEDLTFDTSWAANEFEALLPQLPFTGWETTKENDTTYSMEISGLKDSVVTDDEGNAIGYEEDKAALIAYLESLKNYGFSVEETGGIEGYEYEWHVIDPAGNKIEVTCAEGFCWITITKTN